MALIDIEYGSLASSETMNKNFMYLDGKIEETSESILTSISSILSNIATINARLNDISEEMSDSIEEINSTIEENKAKTKILVNNSSMVPDWSNASSITISSTKKYTVPKNGYILLVPTNGSTGNFIVNGKTVVFKTKESAQLVAFPVCEGDIASCTASLSYAYFLPSIEITVENF